MRRVLRLVPRDPSKRDVLLLCQNGLMAEYLEPVWKAVRNDDRVRFHVTFPDDEKTHHELSRIRAKLGVQEVPLRWAYVKPWDLIITADHGHAELATRTRCPVIYTGHGITGKVLAGEGGDYSYGPRTRGPDGTPRYTCMLEASESNRRRIVVEHPEYADVIRVVGSLKDDEVLDQLQNRRAFREQLGFRDEDTVVFVIGSWGPQSLFHTIGDGLIDAARALSDYRFILCTHPHEYRPRPAGKRVWGEYLRALREEGFSVREPDQSWVPYLVASDVLITDHTSLSIYGVLAGKPMIWSPVPDEVIQEGSALWKLRAICHILEDPRRLGEELAHALTEFPHDRLGELASEINSRPGRSRQLVRELIFGLLDLEPRRRADCPGPLDAGAVVNEVGRARTNCGAIHPKS